MTGLQKMGEIKMSLAQEAAAEEQAKQVALTAPAPAASTWTVLPLVEARLPFVRGRLLLGTILMLLFSLLVGVWARETLSKTAFNRRAYGLLVLSLAANRLLTSPSTTSASRAKPAAP